MIVEPSNVGSTQHAFKLLINDEEGEFEKQDSQLSRKALALWGLI